LGWRPVQGWALVHHDAVDVGVLRRRLLLTRICHPRALMAQFGGRENDLKGALLAVCVEKLADLLERDAVA